MPDLSTFELDRLILSALRPRFMKVARIISDVLQECESRHLEVSHEQIAERIIALDEAGMINSMGDLTKWRWSEICLKPEEGA